MITLWSVKGGSGTSVTTALLAIASAQLELTTVLDADGDIPAIFGKSSGSAGLGDWWQAGNAVGVDALFRLAITISPTLSVIPSGTRPTKPSIDRDFDLGDSGTVLVDGGTIRDADGIGASFVKRSQTSLLVMRPCYLAARRAVESSLRVDGIVLVEEPGRALRASDFSDVIGAPVVATLPWDLSVARTVDSGRFGNRVPRAAKPVEALAKSLFETESRYVR